MRARGDSTRKGVLMRQLAAPKEHRSMRRIISRGMILVPLFSFGVPVGCSRARTDSPATASAAPGCERIQTARTIEFANLESACRLLHRMRRARRQRHLRRMWLRMLEIFGNHRHYHHLHLSLIDMTGQFSAPSFAPSARPKRVGQDVPAGTRSSTSASMRRHLRTCPNRPVFESRGMPASSSVRRE